MSRSKSLIIVGAMIAMLFSLLPFAARAKANRFDSAS